MRAKNDLGVLVDERLDMSHLLNPRLPQKKHGQEVQGGGSTPLFHLFHEESLRKWCLFCLVKRRLWGDLNVAV